MAAGEYCDFSNLRVPECGHCKNGSKPLPRDTMFPANERHSEFRIKSDDELDPGRFGPWFTAQYRGTRCCGCGGHITPGSSIRSDGEGGWLCVACGH